MNKRMRKKHRLCEFTEFGFSVDGKFSKDLPMETYDTFYDLLVPEIEANNLCMGGGSNKFTFGFIVSYCGKGKRTCTEQHREILKSILARFDYITEIKIGNLIDLWHNISEDDDEEG